MHARISKNRSPNANGEVHSGADVGSYERLVSYVWRGRVERDEGALGVADALAEADAAKLAAGESSGTASATWTEAVSTSGADAAAKGVRAGLSPAMFL